MARAIRSPALLLLLPLLSPAAGGATSPAIPLAGEVRDAAGDPIAAATVRLFPVLSNFETRRREALQGALLAAVETKTDAAGRYSLAAPEAGMWHLEIAADGFVPRVSSLLPLLEPQDLPAVLLEPSAGVAVRVVDSKGKPVPGATVTASSVPRRVVMALDEDWSAARRQGVTDEAGRLSLPRGKAEELRLAASAPGFLLGEATTSTASVQITLTPGCPRILEVTLVGKPFAGAVALAVGHGRGVSNEKGRIELLARCGEETAVDLLTEDGRKATRVLPPPSGKGPEKPLTVELPEPRRKAGNVVAADTKEPINGAFVFIDDDPGSYRRADAKGAFSLAVPSATSAAMVPLIAAAPGYVATDLAAGATGAETILALIPAAFAGGLTVDPDGQPVSGAVVRATPERGELPFRMASHGLPGRTVSSATGCFRLPLSPAATYTLKVTHPEYAQAQAKVDPIPARTAKTDLRIVLVRGRTATGRVVDPMARSASPASLPEPTRWW